ncbi:ATP-dependent nuclease [Pectobacterium polaris]|uniref:ATP-dependent nuclease n=1 Tax=Pectobacterium polaris TaxID=2042057 RepID=UPI000E707FFE|nr:AAA family ATPase [Pectobacterium polaris]RJL21888.1 ATP-dependent endonuclease [Pectobacterium polaris]
MYISELVLVNYRNFKRSRFVFDKDINTIIGENGTGKSNLFRAIRFLLDDEMLYRAYKLGGNDFSHDLDDWRGHWIIINIKFKNISHDESVQSIFLHEGGAVDADSEKDVTEASYNLIFRPGISKRLELARLPIGDKDTLVQVRNNISIDDYEVVFTGRSFADFYDQESYLKIVGDFDRVVFPSKIDSRDIGWTISKQMSLSKDISFTFIKALRDVIQDFNGNKRNPLLELLEIKSETLNDEDYEKIIENVISLNREIESLPDVIDVSKGIHSTIRETVGEAFSPTKLSIKSQLPDEPEELLKSLTLTISEGSENFDGTISDMSLGGANLLYLTLKILKYKYLVNKGKVANFILIEEPEAHLHTHIQKALFTKLNFKNTQILYSTHSTQISEASKVSKVNIISKTEGKDFVDVCQPSTGLSGEEINKLERYLDAKRSNLLFAKKVILVEGDAEEIMIPALFSKFFGLTLDELGVTIVNVGSTGFKNIANIFHDKRLRRRCAIITDLDSSLYSDIKKKDTKVLKTKKRKALGSEKIGKERKILLDNFCDKNAYVNPFYADYTFEVEFMSEFGNEEYVINVLGDIYTHESKIESIKKDLKSRDVEVYGDRVLSVAKYAGKGWLALALAEKIDHNVKIPEYIVDALAFSIGKFNKSILVAVLIYRRQFYIEPSKSAELECIDRIIDVLTQSKTSVKRQFIKDLYLEKFDEDYALLRMI